MDHNLDIFMPIQPVIVDYNGFFSDVIHAIYIFFQIYLVSCLVQLLHTFHKMLHFTLNLRTQQ